MDTKVLIDFDYKETKEITIDDADIEVIKSAIEFFINDCNRKIKKISNSNFKLFGELAQLDGQITSLKMSIEDGEQFLKQKDSDNPRNLRDNIENIEVQKALTKKDVDNKKEKLKTLDVTIKALRDSVKQNNKDLKDLENKIKAAKNILSKKISGDEISKERDKD